MTVVACQAVKQILQWRYNGGDSRRG